MCVIIIYAVVMHMTVLHDLSVLVICRTMQINSRPWLSLYISGSKVAVAWVMSLIRIKKYESYG